MKRTKSIVVTIVIIIYLLGIVPRQVAVAEEVPPPDGQEQSADPSPSPDPSPDPSPTPDPNANDQNTEPSPSPTPDPCVSDCPPTEVDQTNDAALDNQVTDVADTGNNTINPSPSPSPDSSLEATGSATPDPSESSSQGSDPQAGDSGNAIDTGDAASQVDLVNLANTNLTNSSVNYHIVNIDLDENGDIDLTKSESYEAQSSANLEITQENTAVINNVITAIANTGANTIDDLSGGITTGTATVVVNIFNFINTNFVNSFWQFVVINIFGEVNGDIILPELGQEDLTLLGAVSGDITQTNSAEVTNTIDAEANTGENEISGSGSIETGDAVTVVNNQNFVNFNLLGGAYYMLLINNLGNWVGEFLGWGNLSSATAVNGQMLFMPYLNLFIDGNGTLVEANQTNNAVLNNQLTATANTGGNLIDGNGQIISGNAYSVVNLVNFVNSNIINSVGFFGIINIFGSLTGDIGGESYFAATTENTQASTQSQNQDQGEVRVEGGQLETSMTTNVGTHVNPGDTLMFFISAKNPGTGPVYDSKVYFNLYDSNGEIATIQTFDLGKLNPGQIAKISFGLVLADTAPHGVYQAIVEAQGKVGPDNQEIASQSQTSFQVGTLGGILAGIGIIPEVQAAGAVSRPADDLAVTPWWWRLLIAGGIMGTIYSGYRIAPLALLLPAFYQRQRRRVRLARLASKLSEKAMAFRSWFFEL